MVRAIFIGGLASAVGEWHWEVVNENAVSGQHLHDAGVWSPGLTDTFEACQNLCAANSSCVAFDWAGAADLGKTCKWKNACYFRSDGVWEPSRNGNCNHTAARKVEGPAPAPSPSQCPVVTCHDDSDCSSLDASCSWCNSPKPGKGNEQLCSGPPSADDCGTLPGKNKTQKLQYASWGDSVSKGIFGQLSGLLVDYESFHPSSNMGGGCGNVVRGKYCTDLWLYGADGDSASRKWDLITFNFGLHDMAEDGEHVSLNAYKRNLRNISSRLLTATASGRLYWLSSTPVPNVKLGPPRPQGDVALYNAAAKEVIDDLGIPSIDLYSFVIEKCGGDEHYTTCPGFQKANNVHFEKEGYKAMADFILASLNDVFV